MNIINPPLLPSTPIYLGKSKPLIVFVLSCSESLGQNTSNLLTFLCW